MRIQRISIAAFVAAGLLLSGNANAQTSTATSPAPAASSQTSGGTSSGSSAPAAKSQTGTGTAKTGTASKTGTGTKTGTATPFVLKTDKQKQSYAIGLNIGKNMQKDGVEIDSAAMLRGIKDAVAGGKVLMTDEEIKTTLTALAGDLKKKQELKIAAESSANKTAGDAFLAANKSKPGVVALPSGLQYKILKRGDGPKPTTADQVTCNYKGTLLNGKEFDSSYKRGEPATFPVGQVIKGWTEALQLMPVGSKWELYIPADLAYGSKQAGPDITPGSTLVFEVELLSIKPKVDPAAAPAATPPPAATSQPATTTPPATPPPSKPQR
jgi:FKBP-type peptidyl-prolyl cis-trans isomerase FklB